MLPDLNWTIWCASLTCVFYVIIKIYDQLTYWKQRGVPHGFDTPFINGLGVFFNRMTFPQMCMAAHKRFPNARYYGSRTINVPMLLVRDIDLIREICIKNFDSFTDHQTFIDASTDPVFGGNVFLLKGQRWKEMRSVLSPSFTANKMKFMFQLVSKCAKDFVAYFEKHLEAAALVDMKDAFTRYTTDVIGTTAFGISVNSLEDKNNEFFLHGKRVNGFGGLSSFLKFAINMISPKLTRLLGITFLPAQTNKFFKGVIEDSVKIRDEKGIVRPDMIHLLMQARDKENINITVDDIVSQAVVFFVAGFDTASTLMCFFAHELAHNPDVQEKLRKEIDECLSSEAEVTYEVLSKMKYMDMVINETLRKYPPAAMIDRVCTKSFKLPPGSPGYSEYNVEVGTVININVYAFHHDPQYFPDPEKFDPERFSDENKDNIDPNVYMPFGLGPRKCIANRFALMETKMLFANLLQHFIIKPSDKTPHPIIFSTNLTMYAKNGFWNVLEKRKKDN